MVRQVGMSTRMPSAKGWPNGHRSSLQVCLPLGSKSSMREIGGGSTLAVATAGAAVAAAGASVATGAFAGMYTSVEGRASSAGGASAGGASLAHAAPPAIAVTSFKNEPR